MLSVNVLTYPCHRVLMPKWSSYCTIVSTTACLVSKWSLHVLYYVFLPLDMRLHWRRPPPPPTANGQPLVHLRPRFPSLSILITNLCPCHSTTQPGMPSPPTTRHLLRHNLTLQPPPSLVPGSDPLPTSLPTSCTHTTMEFCYSEVFFCYCFTKVSREGSYLFFILKRHMDIYKAAGLKKAEKKITDYSSS